MHFKAVLEQKISEVPPLVINTLLLKCFFFLRLLGGRSKGQEHFFYS